MFLSRPCWIEVTAAVGTAREFPTPSAFAMVRAAHTRP
eukprot:COSAG05_NODE_4738_length_1390_cov_1.069713_2_plen_37_part_01